MRLAEAARDAAAECGDQRAQVLAYVLTLRAWGERINAEELFRAVPDSEALRKIQHALGSADLTAVADYYHSRHKDPAIYFYEEFLRAYDPGSARARGVRYTPPEVVAYMVRAIEALLEDEFRETLDRAVVLDPCCGVGTFLRFIQAETLLKPRMIGLELMGASAAIASCLVPDAEIVRADFLADETRNGILRQAPDDASIPVIIGNPPYSGHSTNRGSIADLLVDYRAGLSERNLKWLQDDYVKFIRQAQNLIDSAGRGIVAFITNHSYLFNPTFRAMRSSLLRNFDLISILDLHGNVKKAERADAGEPDGNVFPIQMGVAVSVLVKKSDGERCRVRHAELRGSRQEKLANLRATDFRSTPWQELTCTPPFYVFMPTNSKLTGDYARFVPITEIFERFCVGFVTSRDAFAVDFERDALLERIAALRDPRISASEIRARYAVGDLDIESARRALLDDPDWESHAVEVLYRPFDRRWAYLSRALVERPRLPFMECMLGDNVALAVGRAGHATGSQEWDVAFVTDCPADLNLFRRGGATLFPRWIYENGERRSNIKLANLDPDLVLGYIYAVLFSPTYRRAFAEMLDVDFPRIPLPHDPEAMRPLAKLGQRLIEVHLLRGAVSGAEGEVEPMRIGGYELPRRYVEARKLGGLKDAEARQAAHIRWAIAETRKIQKAIEQAVAESDVLGRRASL